MSLIEEISDQQKEIDRLNMVIASLLRQRYSTVVTMSKVIDHLRPWSGWDHVIKLIIDDVSEGSASDSIHEEVQDAEKELGALRLMVLGEHYFDNSPVSIRESRDRSIALLRQLERERADDSLFGRIASFFRKNPHG